MTEATGHESLVEATRATMFSLQSVLTTLDLSELSLPEIERLSNEVARVAPAGNVPALILNALTQVDGRHIKENESRNYVGLLMRGVRQTVDKAIYGTFFAGPAAVIYGYQQLLRLAGKELDSAFPEGTWQFYLEFALREDTARHANETIGFHRYLQQHKIDLHEGDILASWLLASARVLQQSPRMLENEWREHIVLKLLADIATENKLRKADRYRKLRSEWTQERPFNTSVTSSKPYPEQRHERFVAFYQPYVDALPKNAKLTFETEYQQLEHERLSPYLYQMSWFAYLHPDTHSERRVHYAPESANIGVIWQSRYYLIPVEEVSNMDTARRLGREILAESSKRWSANLDDVMVRISRTEHADILHQLDKNTMQELDKLRHTPIILNWDLRDVRQPLAVIRQGKRGIGEHPITIFRTQESMVFDLSHIFFDGAWGAGIAEILTNEATHQANQLSKEKTIRQINNLPTLYSPTLRLTEKDVKKIRAEPIPPEASANIYFDISTILKLRRHLKQRSDLAQITVNDVFILYRGLHSVHYRPSDSLIQKLEHLKKAQPTTYKIVIDSLEKTQNRNPSILIPIDASPYDPKQRIFPTTFRNPFTDFWQFHQQAVTTLRELEQASAWNRGTRKTFEEARLTYLRMIGGFGQLLNRYKEIATQGESASNASIKALAHIPAPIQRLLDNIPGKFDMLNEVIKGDEVFSNLGRVVRGSSLRRFISAKDDNHLKMFSWGVITDDTDTVHISLRDFRPHVSALYAVKYEALANEITQDYLNHYVDGLLRYVKELSAITTK